jgi:hypothetical protein
MIEQIYGFDNVDFNINNYRLFIEIYIRIVYFCDV